MTNPDSPPAVDPTCTFCDKARVEVSTIIIGPAGVGICNECVMMAADLIIKDQDKLVEKNRLKNVELKALRIEVAGLRLQATAITRTRDEIAKELADKILGVLADTESATTPKSEG